MSGRRLAVLIGISTWLALSAGARGEVKPTALDPDHGGDGIGGAANAAPTLTSEGEALSRLLAAYNPLSTPMGPLEFNRFAGKIQTPEGRAVLQRVFGGLDSATGIKALLDPVYAQIASLKGEISRGEAERLALSNKLRDLGVGDEVKAAKRRAIEKRRQEIASRNSHLSQIAGFLSQVVLQAVKCPAAGQ